MRVALAVALLRSTSAVPAVDHVHSLMEPAQPKPRAPRLKSPYGGNPADRSALVSLSRLVTPKTTLMVLPAVCVGMAAVCPDVLARLLMHVICFFGSLFEPFDSVLPQHGLLRSLVRGRRGYPIRCQLSLQAVLCCKHPD